MTKAEFISIILPAYISKHAEGPEDRDNAKRHANYAIELIAKLESKGVKFSEDDITSKNRKTITDV